MESIDFAETLSQLRIVQAELKKHLGIQFLKRYCIFMNTKCVFFVEQCDNCDSHGPSSGVMMYFEYLRDHLCPEVTKLLFKYRTWWTFKHNSLLKEYLEENNVILDQYFCPDSLCNAICNIAEQKNLIDNGNTNIIYADTKLQECFNLWILYIPDITDYCKGHIDVIPHGKSRVLQNRAIQKEIYVDTPENIVYNDSSSMFWLHPDINLAMNNSAKLIYTWKELNDCFLDFCTTNKLYFTRHENSVFSINSSSCLSTLFKCKYFHQNQIESILKTVTKYLGKTKTLDCICPELETSFNSKYSFVKDKNIFKLIDMFVTNHSKYVPFVYSFTTIQ